MNKEIVIENVNDLTEDQLMEAYIDSEDLWLARKVLDQYKVDDSEYIGLTNPEGRDTERDLYRIIELTDQMAKMRDFLFQRVKPVIDNGFALHPWFYKLYQAVKIEYDPGYELELMSKGKYVVPAKTRTQFLCDKRNQMWIGYLWLNLTGWDKYNSLHKELSDIGNENPGAWAQYYNLLEEDILTFFTTDIDLIDQDSELVDSRHQPTIEIYSESHVEEMSEYERNATFNAGELWDWATNRQIRAQGLAKAKAQSLEEDCINSLVENAEEIGLQIR